MKIAINGFGRIGRNVFKIACERPGMDIVAINDIADTEILAGLLKHDSTYGVYNRHVEVGRNSIMVDGKKIMTLAERSPKNLPWGDLDVDIVIESTGLFRVAESEKGGYKDHIKAGAGKVILTVPARDEIDRTIVLGVNDDSIDEDSIAYSNASCTTNCLAPIVRILHDSFGIKGGLMTTVHAYTSDQVLVDTPHADPRRARAANLNIIPTGTGAAEAIGKVIPELEGKLNGMAMRVPVPVGSVIDFVASLSTDVTPQEVNNEIKKAAEGAMDGIIEYSEAPLVSSDIKGNSHSSIFDSSLTMVLGNGLVKVVSWYDNEFGYSTRVVDLAQKIA